MSFIQTFSWPLSKRLGKGYAGICISYSFVWIFSLRFGALFAQSDGTQKLKDSKNWVVILKQGRFLPFSFAFRQNNGCYYQFPKLLPQSFVEPKSY